MSQEDKGGKVPYLKLNGHVSTAYIDDMKKGEGTDKHTDIVVKVVWDEDQCIYIEVDGYRCPSTGNELRDYTQCIKPIGHDPVIHEDIDGCTWRS